MIDERQKVADALEHLLRDAYGDTGGGRRAAGFLLSLWNGAKYVADLQELLYVEKNQFEDMQTVWQALYQLNAQLDTFLNEDQMKPVIEEWGDVFSRGAS
jgi:hypothetical protein